MSRKVYVTAQVKLRVRLDTGARLSEIMDEMDYSFIDTTGKADILETELVEYDITDSK